MSIDKIIRAWKDTDYRESLSEAERARLPEHPAGLVELDDADLGVAGGVLTLACTTICTTDGPQCLTNTGKFRCCR